MISMGSELRFKLLPRPRLAVLVLAVAVMFLLPAFGQAQLDRVPRIDPADAGQVATGQSVYVARCASCHGAKLEGQPAWRRRLANGRLPAPPHDQTGHTWHHTNADLFGTTKHGLKPYAQAGYESNMLAFDGTLSDDQIAAVIAYIKSTWPAGIRARHAGVKQSETAQ